MIKVDFNYKGIITSIQATENSILGDICKNLCLKVNVDINSLLFLYGGNKVNEKSTINELANRNDKERGKMSILVVDINSEDEETSLKEINQVVCPICKNSCRLHIDDYEIRLFDCFNGHPSKTIPLNEYALTTNIELTEIKCAICKERNKSNTYNNLFYICLNCNINLCPICKSNHNQNHNVINYDDKNYVCYKHNEVFNSFCNSCKINICILCEKEHIGHNLTFYSTVISEKEAKLEDLNILKNKLNILKTDIKNIKEDLDLFLKNVDILYNLNNSIIKHYDIRKRNYQTLTNLSDLKIDLYINEINQIIENKNKGVK